MNKSIVIIIAAIWLICTIYFTLAHTYGLAWSRLAMAGEWVSAILLIVCIVLYLRGQRGRRS